MDFKSLDKVVNTCGGLNRHLFLTYFVSLSSIPWLGVAHGAVDDKITQFKDNPFQLGVASGDPDQDSVVIWTRLSPEPLELNGGMPLQGYAEVIWEVSKDAKFNHLIQSGVAIENHQLGYSVHVEVSGLPSNQWFWYRFKVGNEESRVGRTRTMPANDASANQMRIAVTSCQHFESGYYTAYQQMEKDNPDIVFHLGDYIYEYAGRDNRVRKHIGPEIETLAQYRQRYSQYKCDPDLQSMHAHCPWSVTWDDHEFDNNYADHISEKHGVDKIAFLKRRSAAYQAYYEMMPLRKSSLPKGPDMMLYRTIRFGTLANFYVLDTRQYRTDQPNGDGKKALNANAMKEANSMLGQVQKKWLYQSLNQSEVKWNVFTQQVMMGLVDKEIRNFKTSRYSMDQWPGYAYERIDIMKYLNRHKVSNPVVLTGDIHSNWVNELRVNDLQPETDRVAVEFVTTSLSSGGNGKMNEAAFEKYQSKNPFVKFFNSERGYMICDITPEKWITTFKVIDDVLKPGGKTTIRASYQLNSDEPIVYKI